MTIVSVESFVVVNPENLNLNAVSRSSFVLLPWDRTAYSCIKGWPSCRSLCSSSVTITSLLFGMGSVTLSVVEMFCPVAPNIEKSEIEIQIQLHSASLLRRSYYSYQSPEAYVYVERILTNRTGAISTLKIAGIVQESVIIIILSHQATIHCLSE